MWIVGGIVLIGMVALGYLICAFVKQDPYDKKVSDEEQYKYIEEWRKTHKVKIKK